MERLLKIKIPKTKLSIYGKLRGALKRPLVILVHGLAGEMDERLIFQAAHWFEKKGYSTFRYNQYDWHEDARSMDDVTLKIQAADLDRVISYFKHKTQKIFLIGHSYGAPTILLAKKERVVAVSLWDPSHRINLTKPETGSRMPTYVAKLHGYVHHWGFDVVIGEKMVREAERMRWETLARDVRTPIQIIVAGNGSLLKGSRDYFKQASGRKKIIILKGASHQFVEDGTADTLFSETVAWFRKF